MIHFVKNIPIADNHSEELKEIIFGAGCFWGVEKRFWDIQGVYLTSVGFSGGNTKDPTYEDVCYKDTKHAEVVKIEFDDVLVELDNTPSTYICTNFISLSSIASILISTISDSTSLSVILVIKTEGGELSSSFILSSHEKIKIDNRQKMKMFNFSFIVILN